MTEHKVYPFEFSVIMAVYNVEPWLREAVDSLIAQDFGFENIQLIMVDDGSTDGSGAICDEYAEKYPENVLAIHKENGGVASARNEGLKYATGRFLNFMDSDDKFTKDAFKKVYHFFVKHDSEIDIATIPLEFFDAQKGPHWQNGKFDKGTRVLDLYWDYHATIMFVNASFFANRVKKDIVFDSHLVCGEDMKVLLTVVADKMKLGVVADCKYLYRRRSAGEASLIQSAKLKYGWYFDYFTYLIDWAIEYYQRKFGFLPAFLQYELLCDLQWRFRETYDMSAVLTEEEAEKYKARLFSVLRNFDDKYIMEQKMLFAEHKCYMLSKKYQVQPTLTTRPANIIVHFGNTKLNSVADQYSVIEFITIKDGAITIEGYTKIFGVGIDESLAVYLRCNGELLPCKIIPRESINEYRFDELIFRGVEFCCSVPFKENCKEYRIQLVLECRGVKITKRRIRFGRYSPLGSKYKHSYYYQDGWMLTKKESSLFIQNCGRKEHLIKEWMLLKELWNSNKTGERKAVLGRIAYYIFKKLKHKPIWLISDRVNLANDNGEALFRYIQQNHKKEINAFFALSLQSPDYNRMKEIGKIVPFLGRRHKILFLISDCIISSHGDDYIFQPFQSCFEPYRNLCHTPKSVFLQHGIIGNDLSGWLNRYRRNLSLFVTSTREEYNAILAKEYFYTPKVVKMTGLPRYDRLYRCEKKVITVMPTWRAYLVTSMSAETGRRELKSGFHKSSYYAMYQGLLNSQRLFSAAERLGYTISFLNHPNMSSAADEITYDSRLRVFNENTPYREIFAATDLLITDFSSVAFDFAYLRKPVIYYQEDKAEFFSGAHTLVAGYFDYERDGFGEVEYDLESTVDRIIEYMENGCRLKDKYRERIDGFFTFNDQNNCQRVYDKIMELEN